MALHEECQLLVIVWTDSRMRDTLPCVQSSARVFVLLSMLSGAIYRPHTVPTLSYFSYFILLFSGWSYFFLYFCQICWNFLFYPIFCAQEFRITWGEISPVIFFRISTVMEEYLNFWLCGNMLFSWCGLDCCIIRLDVTGCSSRFIRVREKSEKLFLSRSGKSQWFFFKREF